MSSDAMTAAAGLIRAASNDALAMTSDGYRWADRPVDGDTAARITALLDAGLLIEKSPGMDFTLLEPTTAGRAEATR